MYLSLSCNRSATWQMRGSGIENSVVGVRRPISARVTTRRGDYLEDCSSFFPFFALQGVAVQEPTACSWSSTCVRPNVLLAEVGIDRVSECRRGERFISFITTVAGQYALAGSYVARPGMFLFDDARFTLRNED